MEFCTNFLLIVLFCITVMADLISISDYYTFSSLCYRRMTKSRMQHDVVLIRFILSKHYFLSLQVKFKITILTNTWYPREQISIILQGP